MKLDSVKQKMKHGAVALAAVVGSAGLGSALADAERPGEGVSVTPAVAGWTSAIPVSWVFVELLEELGYDVATPVSLSNPVAYLAISEGDIDYWPSGWFPVHEPQLPDGFRENATLFDAHCPSCGIQGYLVDTSSIERYDITGIEDFVEREEVRNAFDHNGDGRADIYGCPPGWGCHEGIEAMIDEFDLDDYLNHVDAGYVANFSEALSRIESGEPALYYTWGPSAWITRLTPGEQVMWINAPGEGATLEGLEGAVTDPIELGWAVEDIKVAANDAFLEANPAAAELFRRVRLDLDWIARVDATMDEEGLSDADVRPMAAEWIEANRDRVDEWLRAARQAAQ